MKRLLLIPIALLMSAGAAPAVPRQEAAPGDRSLSPYFFVKSDDPELDELPLKATTASVDIAGVIARVIVTQEYANEGKRPIEAVYVFPGSTRAAVHAMRMKVGDRTLTARIERREEARRQYEGARQAGQTASLLEQQRPNVFQMNVANILPGDLVAVELVYTELLVPENGIYEFVYPAVIGPRYTNAMEETVQETGRWVKNPYLHEGERSPYRFDLAVNVASGMPLRDLASPSHDVQIDFVRSTAVRSAGNGGSAQEAAQRARVRLAESETEAGNRDFVLRYRLAENRIETGVLAAAGDEENYFLLMVEPPARVVPEAVPPREYLFIMDVSGSMNGFPIETSKELVSNVLDRLRPEDYFNVLFFAAGSYNLSPVPLPATEVNKHFALQEVGRQRGSGGTELLPALQNAFAMPRAGENLSRVIVIATDGYVDVEREAFDLIRARMDEANVFTFGIGSSVNRYLVEGMARVGEGLPFVVLNEREAPALARRFLRYIASPLLTRVELTVSGLDACDIEPARMPDLFAERPLVVTGRCRGPARGTIRVAGLTGGGRFERTLNVTDASFVDGDALKYLWARERLALLSDYAMVDRAEAERKEIENLGLEYSLLTPYTSFVAIDERVRRTDGKVETVRQPLPMPQGVSDLAAGQAGGAVPVAGSLRGGVALTPAMQPRGETFALDAAKVAARTMILVPPTGGGAVEVEIVRNNLVGAGEVPDARLARVVGGALSGLSRCLSGAAPPDSRLVRIRFDGSGRVERVEVLEQERWKDPASVLKCIDEAIRHALVLPWRAGGEIEARVTVRR